MDLSLRPALPADFAALRAIAADGGSPDGDDAYFRFVASTGKLVLAEEAGVVVGFAGAVTADETTIVSDLFVAGSHRSSGVGRRLLGDVLAGSERRMTFSSTDPAALSLYASFGLQPGARLLTMRGVAPGGGTRMTPAPWHHARPELVSYLATCGATVFDDVVAHVGVHVSTILRLVGSEPQSVLDALLRSLPSACVVELSVLESHPLVEWLRERGFTVSDHDIHCASPGATISPDVSCVHRGLC